MIRYDLRCGAGHEFEAWFRSSDAYDEQRAAGHVRCVVCGSDEVEKQLMAPAVHGGRRRSAGEEEAPLSRPRSPAEALLHALRRHIESTSDYVGADFAREARRIHLGEAEKRSIWGEASLEEARALCEEGVPVTPIPWMRRSQG